MYFNNCIISFILLNHEYVDLKLGQNWASFHPFPSNCEKESVKFETLFPHLSNSKMAFLHFFYETSNQSLSTVKLSQIQFCLRLLVPRECVKSQNLSLLVKKNICLEKKAVKITHLCCNVTQYISQNQTLLRTMKRNRSTLIIHLHTCLVFPCTFYSTEKFKINHLSPL